MTTQELKNSIEKVLGNSIRCLLPSYWWKKLFHSVADRIDEVETIVTKNVSDMVVKSLKEFEAKHPEMASTTLYFTVDAGSAEALANVSKFLRWGMSIYEKPAGTIGIPLYVAIPVGPEDIAYCIQSPAYIWDTATNSIIFHRVVMSDGKTYNISFGVTSGVAALTEKKDESIIAFIAPAGELTAEAKQQNKESYAKVYEAFDDAVTDGTVTFDVKVNGGLAVFDATAVVYPILNQLVINFINAGGVKQKLIVTEDGTTTMEELLSESDLSLEVVAIAPDYRELDDDEKAVNYESYFRILGSAGRMDIKVFYRISSEEVQPYTVTSIEVGDSSILRLKAADAEKIFLLSNDGNVTIEDIAPPEKLEIRQLRISSNLSDEDKAYNIETVQKYKEGKVLVVMADEQSDGNITVSRMVAPFFVDIYPEGSNELAAFSFVVLESGNVDTIVDRGQMVVAYVSVFSDGHIQGAVGGLYDAEMSDTSTLAVRNKVIKAYVDGLVALLATKDELTEAEEVAAAALNDLEGRKADREEVVKAIAELNVPALATKDELTEAEEVAAAALNDLDNRLKEIVSQINI